MRILIDFVIMTLGGSVLGVKFLDPLAGLVVSGMIFKAGLETGYQRYYLLSIIYAPSNLLTTQSPSLIFLIAENLVFHS